MNEHIIKRIVEAYGLTYKTIHPPQKGYRNSSFPITLSDGQLVNCILYKREPDMLSRILRANNVSNFLASHEMPVRKTVDARIVKMQTGPHTRYAGLYNYLPGQTIPWEAYTKAHLKLLGAAMSTMHQLLQPLEAPVPNVIDEYSAITERMRHYGLQPPVQQALFKKLQLTINPGIFLRFNAILQACRALPNQQVLHMDFVRSNLLFAPASPHDRFVEKGLALSGILDFEKVAYGHPHFDIARTLAFLLVDCKHKTASDVRKYFLRSGYNKRGAAAFKKIMLFSGARRVDLLEELLNIFLFYDFYKFLRHNPYESLPHNEHFMRTRDMLLERQMLQYG